MSHRPIQVIGNLAHLSGSATGSRHLVWWGNFGFMLIEGVAFVLAAGCYFYLIGRSPSWPPAGDDVPDLFWGTTFTFVLLASEVPNLVLLGMAKRQDANWVRWLALLLVAIGVALAAIRWVE